MVKFYFWHNSSHLPWPNATGMVSRGDLTALGSLIPSFLWTPSRNSSSLKLLHECARYWFDWSKLDLGLIRTRGRQSISFGQVAFYLLWLSQGRFGTEWSPLDPAGMNIGPRVWDLWIVVSRICELSRVCARPESGSIRRWLVDSDFRIGSICRWPIDWDLQIGSIRRWIVDSILVRLVIGLTCIGTGSDLAAFHILVLHKGSFGTEASTLTC
jgi:hypothetical protein